MRIGEDRETIVGISTYRRNWCYLQPACEHIILFSIITPLARRQVCPLVCKYTLHTFKCSSNLFTEGISQN
jgi:hypothetical protein